MWRPTMPPCHHHTLSTTYGCSGPGNAVSAAPATQPVGGLLARISVRCNAPCLTEPRGTPHDDQKQRQGGCPMAIQPHRVAFQRPGELRRPPRVRSFEGCASRTGELLAHLAA